MTPTAGDFTFNGRVFTLDELKQKLEDVLQHGEQWQKVAVCGSIEAAHCVMHKRKRRKVIPFRKSQ